MRLRFHFVISIPDGSKVEEIKGARKLLRRMATEIVKASAKWSDNHNGRRQRRVE